MNNTDRTTLILVKMPGQVKEKQPTIPIIVGPTSGEYRKLAKSTDGKVIQINHTSENTKSFNPFEIPIKILTKK